MAPRDQKAKGFSPLAALLGGLDIRQAEQDTPPAASVLAAATKSTTIPGALAAAPSKSPAFSVSALPNTAARPTLSTFVPYAAPEKAAVATALTPHSVTSSPEGMTYVNRVAQDQRGMYQRKIEQYSAPLDPDEYRPRWWQRLGAAAATFGASMQHNPNAIAIGNEILNQNFARADYRRLQGLKGAKEELEAFDQGERLRRQQQDDVMRLQEFALRRSNLDRQNRLTDAQIADYESKRKDREADNARDPGAKLRAELNLRKRIADELGLRGDDRMYYVVNNRLREPNPDAEARLAETRANREQRQADADERAYNSAWMRHQTQLGVYHARKAALDDKARRAWDALQADFEGEYYGDSNHTAVAFNRDSDEDKKAVLDKYEARKQKLQSDLDVQYRDLGAPPKEPPMLSRSSGSGRKAASRAEVEAFARHKGLSVEAVEKQLKAKGYDIVAGSPKGR